jgi:hypothetical protein
MIETLLMWFPACALFVTLAYVTEFAWRAEQRKERRRFTEPMRRVIEPDTRPLMYRGEDTPIWKTQQWNSL